MLICLHGFQFEASSRLAVSDAAYSEFSVMMYVLVFVSCIAIMF